MVLLLRACVAHGSGRAAQILLESDLPECIRHRIA
jgi:hypothetical protein